VELVGALIRVAIETFEPRSFLPSSGVGLLVVTLNSSETHCSGVTPEKNGWVGAGSPDLGEASLELHPIDW